SLFFFSSRRRHTRFSRDWSSDVCSSDLPIMKRRTNRDDQRSGPGAPTSKADHAYESILQSILDGEYAGGERLVIERLARELGVKIGERRVGRERRAWGWAADSPEWRGEY